MHTETYQEHIQTHPKLKARKAFVSFPQGVGHLYKPKSLNLITISYVMINGPNEIIRLIKIVNLTI